MEEFALALGQENMGALTELDVAPFFCALIPRVWIKSAEDCCVHHFCRGSFSKMISTQYLTIFDQNLRRFEQKWGKPLTQHKFRRDTRPEHVQHSPVDFNMASPPRWVF